MPYINTIDVNGTIYNLGNLTNGTYMVDLPEDLRKNDILVLQGDIVDSIDNDNPPHNKPLSAYQGKLLNDKINVLSDNLNSEISSSVSDLSSKINEERDRAQSAEETLTINLSKEITRATGVEGNLNTAITNEVKRATDIEAGLNTAIANEKDRADKAEKANAAAIKVITDDYLKSVDKTALEGAINTEKSRIDAFLAAADTGDKAIDTLKEIQNYIDTHGEAAAEMATNIGKNTTDIKALQDVVGTGSGDSTGLFKAITDAETSAKAYADDNFIKQTSIADNLSTDSSGQVLSAKQGKSLDEKKFDKTGGTISGDVTVNADITIGDNTHGITVSKVPSTDSDVANKKYVDAENSKLNSTIETLSSTVDTYGGQITTIQQSQTNLQNEFTTIKEQTKYEVKAIKTSSDGTTVTCLFEVPEECIVWVCITPSTPTTTNAVNYLNYSQMLYTPAATAADFYYSISGNMTTDTINVGLALTSDSQTSNLILKVSLTSEIGAYPFNICVVSHPM